MPIRRWRTISVLVFLAGAASGCAETQADAPSKHLREVAVPEPGRQARQLTLPFDAYNFSPAEVITLEVAEDLLVRDCMRGLGLDWRTLPGPAESESAPPHRRRYGVIESEMADVFGYHLPPDRPAVAAHKANHRVRMEAAPPKVRDAAKRCRDQARARMVTGPAKADAAFFNEIIFTTFDASQRDGKVTRVFRAWSECMVGEGLRYPDPLSAVTDKRWATGQTTAEEIRAAQADVRCKEKTGLVSVWAAAETRLQNDVIRAHPQRFPALRAVKVKQLETARRIIAQSPRSDSEQ
ncbi:hypothetical protein [Sinosporangium siamense]|nr:hypothetical protein [Sinosporangium siamense]